MIPASTGGSEWPMYLPMAFPAVVIFLVVAARKIASKAGYSSAWGFIIFAPIFNFFALWVFAFSRWPILDGLVGITEQDRESLQ